MPTPETIKNEVENLTDAQHKAIITFCDHPQSKLIMDFLEEWGLFEEFREYIKEKAGQGA